MSGTFYLWFGPDAEHKTLQAVVEHGLHIWHDRHGATRPATIRIPREATVALDAAYTIEPWGLPAGNVVIGPVPAKVIQEELALR